MKPENNAVADSGLQAHPVGQVTRVSEQTYRVDGYLVTNPAPAQWTCDCDESECGHLALLQTLLIGMDLPVGQTLEMPPGTVLHVDGRFPLGSLDRLRWVPEAVDLWTHQYFADLERDGRADTSENLSSWLWFTCPADLRDAVSVEIARQR